MKWKTSLKQLNLLKILFFLLKGVSETIQNEAKKQKETFLSIFLGTLGAGLLSNILADKGVNRAGEGFLRAGYGFSIKNKDF